MFDRKYISTKKIGNVRSIISKFYRFTHFLQLTVKLSVVAKPININKFLAVSFSSDFFLLTAL